MLNDSFRQQIEFALQREARRYDLASLYASAEVLEKVQAEVGGVLKENVSLIWATSTFAARPSTEKVVPSSRSSSSTSTSLKACARRLNPTGHPRSPL